MLESPPLLDQLFPAPPIPDPAHLSTTPAPRTKQPSPLQTLMASVPNKSPPNKLSYSDPLTAPIHQQQSSPRATKFIESEYAIHMAKQAMPGNGNIKAAATARNATVAKKSVVVAKPVPATKGRPAGAENKPKVNPLTQAKPPTPAKPAGPRSKQAPPHDEEKHGKMPTPEEMQNLARFDWLLRQFLNAANALQKEFGGIPDKIRIVTDRYDRYIAQAVRDGYTGVEDDNDEPERQDLFKLIFDKSIQDHEDKISKYNGDFPQPMKKDEPLISEDFIGTWPPKAPQYTMDPSGGINLPEELEIYQKPEHILQILSDLNLPLGFSPAAPQNPSTTTSSPSPATEILIKDNLISLTPPQWDIVKDCLTVVHYMNDYSDITAQEMYHEARASWIRMFGWAPGVEEMVEAKERARGFREESGRHITALGTKAWIGWVRKERERGGCAVFQYPRKRVEMVEKKVDGTGKSEDIENKHMGLEIEKDVVAPSVERKSEKTGVEKAENLILKAAINDQGKAFIPATPKITTPSRLIYPSMAAHTIIPAESPRKDSLSPLPTTLLQATTPSPKKPVEVIDLSEDEDSEPEREESEFAITETTIAKSNRKAVRGHELGEEHKLSSSRKAEMVNSLVPVRDQTLYPGEPSSSGGGLKRKNSPNLSSDSANKRQNTGLNGSVGLAGSSDLGGLVGSASLPVLVPPTKATVTDYMRWEEARNLQKRLERDARILRAEGRVIDERDIEMDFS